MNPKSDLKIKQYFDMTDYHENDKKLIHNVWTTFVRTGQILVGLSNLDMHLSTWHLKENCSKTKW